MIKGKAINLIGDLNGNYPKGVESFDVSSVV
jgi:hypothetical protein